jgi:hypothetical protein
MRAIEDPSLARGEQFGSLLIAEDKFVGEGIH